MNLTTTLSPTSITVSNNSKTYVFKGPGALGNNAAAIQKFGSGTLVITNSGANAFAGTVNINGGTVQLGLAANRLPTAASVALANVSGAVLDLGGQDQTLNALSGGGANGGNVNLGAGTLTVSAGGAYSGVINGTGGFVKAGIGNLLLPVANLYGGGTTVSGGSLTLDNASGSATGTGPVTIGTGATLTLGQNDLAGSVSPSAVITNNGTLVFTRNDLSTYANQIVGSGAVVLSPTNFNTVSFSAHNTYSGGTTIGTSALRVSDPTTVGTGFIYVENVLGGVPGPHSVLQVVGGINLTNEVDLDQKNAGAGVVPAVESVSGNNTLSGPVVLFIGGSYWRFQVDTGKLTITGPVNNTTSGSRFLDLIGPGDGEWVSGITAGTGSTGVYMDGTGTWTLSGDNTYTGPTTVSSGKLVVNGVIESLSTLEVQAGATLAGTGVISSPITVDAGGILSPGNSIGTLVCSNLLIMSSGSTNVFDLNGATLACDQVIGLSQVSYGGDLKLVISGGLSALTNQAAIKLFDAQTYALAFDTIEPASPGAGLVWDTSTLAADGTLRIATSSTPALGTITYLGGTSFQITGTGPDGASYRILAATNLVPSPVWFQVSSGTFSGGGFSFTDTGATNSQRFYRVVSP